VPILQLSRLRNPVIAAAAIGAALLFLDVGLGLALGIRPPWLPASFDAWILSDVGSRLARVEQLERAGQINDRNLIAVVGLSPVREDCDPPVLQASDPLKRHWLVLGGQGRTFATMEVFGRALAESPVHPRRVVLGVVPAMVHHDNSAEPQDSTPRRLLGDLRRRRIYHVLLDASWLFRNRDALADECTLLIYQAQRRTRLLCRLPMSATYPPESDPWTSWTAVFKERTDPGMMKLQWQGHQTLLNPAQFADVGCQIDALSRLVAELRSNGAEVICVLMPETSRLRAIYPPVVRQRFDEALAAASAGEKVPFLDLRGDIPDDMFYDDAHLNPRGRHLFSTLLPALLP
jgi:hypothetical protein